MATKVINSLTFGDTYVLTTPYATSSTGASTQAKVATLTPNSNFSLETGVRVAVKFSAENTASSPTLNVNSSGAKTIQFRGAALTSSLYRWAANSVVEFMYDGTYWQMLGAPNNTNSTYTVNNKTITLSAGTGLSGGGDFTTNQSTDETISFSLAASGVTAGTYGPSANVTGNNNATMSVPEITVDAYGRITSIVNRTYTAKNTDTDTNTHYTTKLFATSSTGTAHAVTTNGNTYLRLFDDSTARQSIKITGSGATTVASDANGVITISSTDSNTNYYHTRAYSTGLKISTGTGVSDMYVPVGTTSSLGVVKQHTAADCTSYTSDEGATTPAAVKKAVGQFVTVTPSLTSGTKVGTITVNGTDNDLYCQTNTDTKVTQNAVITTAGSYPVILGNSTATTAVTGAVNKSSKLLFNPSTGNLSIGTSGTDGSGSITLEGSLTMGSAQTDSQGIMPRASNRNSLGMYNKYWYRAYVSTVYCGSIKTLSGGTFSFPATITWNTF